MLENTVGHHVLSAKLIAVAAVNAETVAYKSSIVARLSPKITYLGHLKLYC